MSADNIATNVSSKHFAFFIKVIHSIVGLLDSVCHSTERIIPEGAFSQLLYVVAGQIPCYLLLSKISSKIKALIVVKF
jgi:hypothetical protein